MISQRPGPVGTGLVDSSSLSQFNLERRERLLGRESLTNAHWWAALSHWVSGICRPRYPVPPGFWGNVFCLFCGGCSQNAWFMAAFQKMWTRSASRSWTLFSARQFLCKVYLFPLWMDGWMDGNFSISVIVISSWWWSIFIDANAISQYSTICWCLCLDYSSQSYGEHMEKKRKS